MHLIVVIVFHGGQVIGSNVSDIAEMTRLRRVTVLYPIHLLRAVLFYPVHLRKILINTISHTTFILGK